MMENKKIANIDKEIANALVETKAIDFDALGKVVSKFGAASMLMDDDGWIRWCGNDLRIYRWPRGRYGLEDINVLKDILKKEILNDIRDININQKL